MPINLPNQPYNCPKRHAFLSSLLSICEPNHSTLSPGLFVSHHVCQSVSPPIAHSHQACMSLIMSVNLSLSPIRTLFNTTCISFFHVYQYVCPTEVCLWPVSYFQSVLSVCPSLGFSLCTCVRVCVFASIVLSISSYLPFSFLNLPERFSFFCGMRMRPTIT